MTFQIGKIQFKCWIKVIVLGRFLFGMEIISIAQYPISWINWAEQHKVTEIKEVQSVYFNRRCSYDLHTGYCYSKEDSHSFVSLSDSSDHNAEAIRNALKLNMRLLPWNCMASKKFWQSIKLGCCENSQRKDQPLIQHLCPQVDEIK